MSNMLEVSKQIFEQTKADRDFFHRNPELSFCETETSKYIISQLDNMGIEYHIINKTSIIGIIEHNDSLHKNTIALRADIDGLPIIENKEYPNKSTNGAMHACGHDVHAASLLSSARILQNEIRNHSATIVLIFQQGEEVLPGGASWIIESGILDKYNPKLIIGQHVEYTINTGEYGVCEGTYMASGDELNINIRGTGGHAAIAGATNNPIYPASKLILELKRIEELSPKGIPTILSIGKVTTDGGATNIVPENIKIEGTFRTMNEKWRVDAKAEMLRKALSIQTKYNVSIDFNIIKGYSMLFNEPEIAKKAIASLETLGKVHKLPPRMTTEDFGAYSTKYPTIYYRCGVKSTQWSELYHPHTSNFKVDEKSLIFSVAGLTKLALDYIGEIK